MDIKEYISSGIVELYAMNALSPEDKKEFEKLGMLYPEITEELNKVEKNLESYATSNSLNPRPGLREGIVNKLRKKEDSVTETPNAKKPAEVDHSLTYKYLIAASLAALVISTFASWFFYSRWNEAEERYTDLLKEKNDLTVNYNVVKATYDETLASLLITRDEHASVITLHSLDTAFHYQVRIYWNKINQHTYLDVLSLPDPGVELQYQLWAIAGDKLVDAGVFQVERHNIQRAKDIVQADAWIITIEPRGGSAIPSTDKIFLDTKNN